MNVLFFPYYPSNPYQPNLAKALGKRGIDVQGIEDSSLGTMVRSAKGHDILHLHWTDPYFIAPKIKTSVGNAFLFFARLVFLIAKGQKLIWTVHNLGEHERQHPRFELFCHQLLARLASGIIVHSQHAREQTARKYRLGRRSGKIRVIPHGNYIGNYPNDISREQARGKLGIGPEKVVFLFLGQIRPYKNLPELIAAFTRVAKGNEMLVLAGKPLNEQIEAEIHQLTEGRRDIVFAPRFVPDGDIQLFMNAADAVVYPFRDIFTSGSVLLAMSFARALILPDLASLAEIKEAGGAITYDPHSSNGLEGALNAALYTDLQTLGHLNFLEAQKLSCDSIAEDVAGFYEEILTQ